MGFKMNKRTKATAAIIAAAIAACIAGLASPRFPREALNAALSAALDSALSAAANFAAGRGTGQGATRGTGRGTAQDTGSAVGFTANQDDVADANAADGSAADTAENTADGSAVGFTANQDDVADANAADGSAAGTAADTAAATVANTAAATAAATAARSAAISPTTTEYRHTNDPDRAYAVSIGGGNVVSFAGNLDQIAFIATRRDDMAPVTRMKMLLRGDPLDAPREYESDIRGGGASFEVGSLPDGPYYVSYGASSAKAGFMYSMATRGAVVADGQLAFTLPTAYSINSAATRGYSAPPAGECLDYLAYNGDITAMAQDIASDARDSYHAAKLINIWVANNVYYDVDETQAAAEHSQSPAVVFRDRTAICYGYANITQALLNAIGIQARCTVGTTASGEHSWTEAYIDGRWVFLDSTWESSNRYYGSTGKYQKGATVKPETLRYFDMTLEYLSEAYVYGNPPKYSERAPAQTSALAALPSLWPDAPPPSERTDAQAAARAAETRDAATSAAQSAAPTSSAVLLDGKITAFAAYNINDANYFKLRDLAYALSGSRKQFDVSWDSAANAVNITPGKKYAAIGSEAAAAGGNASAANAASAASATSATTSASATNNAALSAPSGSAAAIRRAVPSQQRMYIGGKPASLAAYSIDDANYVKLRDVGAALDFDVTWNGAAGLILIDTGKSYTPD
jgi:hypothetical protein